MADIDPEPARDRLAHDRVHPPVAPDKAAGMPGERVGKDIARLQEVEDVGQDAVGVDRPSAIAIAALRQRPELAEMDVKRQPAWREISFARRNAAWPQRANPPISACALMPRTRSGLASATLTVPSTSMPCGP